MELDGVTARAVRLNCALTVTRRWLDGWHAWLLGLPRGGPARIRCQSIERRYRRRALTVEELFAGEAPRYVLEEALLVERAMRELPDQQRRALKISVLQAGDPLGKKCERIGVAKSRYYQILRAGELMLRNLLTRDARFRAQIDLITAEELRAAAELRQIVVRALTRVEENGQNPVRIR